MRRVTRLPAPPTLQRYTERWTQELLAAIRAHSQGQGPKPPDKLWNKYAKGYVRDQLERMFLGKCAYCESYIGNISFSRIDHYRPKRGGYPALTFSWENLILSCELCNHHKSNHFPVHLVSEGESEQPLLLNPCDDNPDEHLFFEGARIIWRDDRGERTISILQLNRDDLLDVRRQRLEWFIFTFTSIVEHLRNGNTDLYRQGIEIINELLQDNAEFTMMLRQAHQRIVEQ